MQDIKEDTDIDILNTKIQKKNYRKQLKPQHQIGKNENKN